MSRASFGCIGGRRLLRLSGAHLEHACTMQLNCSIRHLAAIMAGVALPACTTEVLEC